MQANERYDLILQMLANQEMVTITELMNAFDVSIQTIRRDLNYLEQERLIKKVYGGAILFNRPALSGKAREKRNENSDEKSAIGRECAKLINDGDAIYLGVGTTVREVAKCLRNHKKLTVLTASIYVLNELLESDITVYFMGGALHPRDVYISNIIPPNAWDFFCPQKAIIGCNGVSPDYGITDHAPNTAHTIRSIVDRSMSVIAVADNSKFGQVGSSVICPMNRVNRLITGSAKKEEILNDFPNYHHRFIFADGYTPKEAALTPGVLSDDDLL